MARLQAAGPLPERPRDRGRLTALLPLAAARGALASRLGWGWAIAIALGASLAANILHHVPALADHALSVTAAVIVASAGLALLPAFLARDAGRTLPAVVTADPSALATHPLQSGDVGFCAALHAAVLEHGFFASLGLRFMRRYYATFASSPHATGLLAWVGEQPVGMVVGILRPQAHVRWVLRHRGVGLAIVAAAALALRPLTALRFVRTRVGRYLRAWRRARGSADPPAETSSEPGSAGPPARQVVLSHVAVLPGAQGIGAGRRLVEDFAALARADGAAEVVLTTMSGERGAGAFYRSLGWRFAGARATYDGDTVDAYSLTLDRAEP